MRFKWYGWDFYIQHNREVTRQTWNQDLRPVRALLSAISISIGVFFLFPNEIFLNSGYYYLRSWVSEETFGSVFILHGVGLTWRNYSPTQMNLWGRAFGALGIALYVGYPLAICFGLGHERGGIFLLTGQSVALLWLGFACAWCAHRIGNGEDRSGG